MRSALTRSRSDDCMSDLRLDELLAEELDEATERTTVDHLARCAACARRRDEIEASRAEFLRDPPPLRLAGRPAGSRRRAARWAAPVAGALALAAGAVVVVHGFPLASGPEAPVASAPDVRLKGGSRIGFYVSRNGSVSLGGPGERVAPGDALRFVYSATEPCYLAVLSVDGARKASVYFPQGPAAVRVDAGRDVPLPTSTVLDGTLGHEALYGVFCSTAIDLEPVRAALEARPDAPAFPDGCTVDRLTIDKAEAP